MALPTRIPVRFTDVFPHGAYALGVEPVRKFEQGSAGPPAQDRDKDTGEPLWAVRVLDPDPNGRAGTAEVRVKLASTGMPVLPATTGSSPLRPVEFDGVTVTPYVDRNRTLPRVAYSLRAETVRALRPAVRTSGTAA